MKRSPLLRKSPLKRGGLTATTPVNPPAENNDPALSKTRPHRGLKPIPHKTREAVKERDQYRCVACSTWLGETGGHVHHRKLRSQGGDNAAWNLIYICAKHHNAIHAAPRVAYELGYLVRSYDDPALVAIETLWPGACVDTDTPGIAEDSDRLNGRGPEVRQHQPGHLPARSDQNGRR